MKKVKFFILIFIYLSILYILVLFLKLNNIGFIYQNTNSMKKGLYFTYSKKNYYKGDTVIFKLSKFWENFMRQRKYFLPNSSLIMKKIVASFNDKICWSSNFISINGKKKAKILIFDRKKRPLPNIYEKYKKRICINLSSDDFIMIGINSNYSFDSRYFGVINKKQIIAKAVLLWEV